MNPSKLINRIESEAMKHEEKPMTTEERHIQTYDRMLDLISEFTKDNDGQRPGLICMGFQSFRSLGSCPRDDVKFDAYGMPRINGILIRLATDLGADEMKAWRGE